MISIHALREEGDYVASSKTTILPLFLSTPSARRATVTSVALLTSSKFLSTPSARRATLMKSAKAAPAIFLSTPSARRATPGRIFFSPGI